MKKFLILLICISLLNPCCCFAITDDFAETSLDKNSTIKNTEYKPIYDDFAEQNTNKNVKKTINVKLNEVLPENPDGKTIKKTKTIDYGNILSVPLRIQKPLSTGQDIKEGDFVYFETTKDIIINNITYPKGTTVKARIETISPNETMGVPADLAVGNFEIDDNLLIGEITKVGANRSLWVYPLYTALVGFFGIGLILVFIPGGQAKITTTEIYTVYSAK